MDSPNRMANISAGNALSSRIEVRSVLHHDATLAGVRTTVTLADDVAAVVRRLRTERGIGVSEAVNELIRAGIAAPVDRRKPFRQRTYALGLKIDVTSVADALDYAEGPDHR